MRENSKKTINYKKLFFEVLAIFILVFIAEVNCLSESIAAYAQPVDKYEELREVVNDAKDYDYKNGRNEDFEKALDDGFSNVKNKSDKKFYYGLARAIYYCNIGYYNTANDTFEQLNQYSVDDEKDILDADVQKVLCERKQENEE